MKHYTNKKDFLLLRCSCCDFSNAGLHDNFTSVYSGNSLKPKKHRQMYKIGDDFLCEYCHDPERQFKEQNAKTKVYETDLGELEIELAKWNKILAEEDLEEIL